MSSGIHFGRSKSGCLIESISETYPLCRLIGRSTGLLEMIPYVDQRNIRYFLDRSTLYAALDRQVQYQK